MMVFGSAWLESNTGQDSFEMCIIIITLKSFLLTYM